jgi:PhnB protein
MSAKKEASLRAIITGIAFLILLPSARAQHPPKPGKEHDHLKRLVGIWDTETDFGKGTMTYKMGLDGLWLVGDFVGEFGGIKFQGKSLDTYDEATKKYQSVWVDSFFTMPRIMEGNLGKGDKVMTMTGEGRGPDDKPSKFKSITEIQDADTVNFSLFMVDKDGKEQPMTKITYKRKKNIKENSKMQLTTYLLLDGTCKDAMTFYHSVFGGELTMTTVGDSPMKAAFPATMHGKIISARLKSKVVDISASDWLRPGEKPIQGNTVCLYVSGGNADETKTFFDKLSVGAKVTDPLSQLPFGLYGALNDKFGNRWMFHSDAK